MIDSKGILIDGIVFVLNGKLAVVWFLLFFSNNLYAGLIQWDAFNAGDELAVKDESTGLVWLDLSVSANVHYNDAGLLFEGWDYAGYEYVEALLTDTFFDLRFTPGLGEEFLYEQACANTTSCFESAKNWQELFGSTQGLLSYQTYSFGFYKDEQGILRMGGTFLNGTGSASRYGVDFKDDYSATYDDRYNNDELYLYSTFLLKNDSLPTNTAQSSQVFSSVSEPDNTFAFVMMLSCILMMKRKDTIKI